MIILSEIQQKTGRFPCSSNSYTTLKRKLTITNAVRERDNESRWKDSHSAFTRIYIILRLSVASARTV